jgi:hypothetical protein
MRGLLRSHQHALGKPSVPYIPSASVLIKQSNTHATSTLTQENSEPQAKGTNLVVLLSLGQSRAHLLLMFSLRFGMYPLHTCKEHPHFLRLRSVVAPGELLVYWYTVFAWNKHPSSSSSSLRDVARRNKSSTPG